MEGTITREEVGDPKHEDGHVALAGGGPSGGHHPARTLRRVRQQPDLGLLALIGAALGLAGAGQLYFRTRPEFFWDGVILYGLAMLLFVLAAGRAVRRLRPLARSMPQPTGRSMWPSTPATVPPAGGEGEGTPSVTPPRPSHQGTAHEVRPLWEEIAEAVRLAPWRLVALIAAVALIWMQLGLLRVEPQLPNYDRAVVFWFVGIGLYLLAVAPPVRRPRHDWGLWWEINRKVVVAVSLIVLVAFVVRVWQLETIPWTLGGDEGSQGLEAIKIIRGEMRNPFTTGWLGVPTMSFFFNMPTIRWLGNTIFALRFPWVIVGTATVLIFFWLVTRLKGIMLGLIAAALLATYHYHIHFSRLGSNQVADPLFVVLALLFLYRAYDRRSPLDWALVGVVVGVAQFFYAGARFTTIIVMGVTAFFFVREGLFRFWREQRSGVLIMIGAGLLVSAPMIQYALRFPNDYNARLNQVGIVQSGWLEREAVIRNQSTLAIVLDQTRLAGLAFNSYPDRTVWYGSPRPLFDGVGAVLFLLGLGYATFRLWDPRLFPMVAWWWGAMFLGGALTESPPSSQRLITLAPPAIFFVALAIQRLAQLALRGWSDRDSRPLIPILGLAVLWLSYTSLDWYFVRYNPLYVYGGFNGVVATALGKQAAREFGPESRIFFFGAPRMYVGFGSIPYLALETEGIDMNEPLTAPLDRSLIPTDKDAIFVFLPERRNELAFVQQTFPAGALYEAPAPAGLDDEPLYLFYRVPREALTQ